MRLLAARLTTAAVLALTPVTAGAASAAAPEPTPAPLHTTANAIPGSYIVTLIKSFRPSEFAQTLGLKPKFTYGHALNGFAANLDEHQLKAVREAYGVVSVDQDARVSAPPAPEKGVDAMSPAHSWGWTGSTSGSCRSTTTSAPTAAARG